MKIKRENFFLRKNKEGNQTDDNADTGLQSSTAAKKTTSMSTMAPVFV